MVGHAIIDKHANWVIDGDEPYESAPA
jgi:hypothetical protein